MVFSTRIKTKSTTAMVWWTIIAHALLLLLLLPTTTLCFAPAVSSSRRHRAAAAAPFPGAETVRLFATTPPPPSPTGKRREVFGWLKKAATAVTVGFGTSSALIGTKSSAAGAATTAVVSTLTDEQMAAVTGRVVTFTVQNLDGDSDASQSGTVKIQLAPSWAPRGVARFEVRTVCYTLCIYKGLALVSGKPISHHGYACWAHAFFLYRN
jgi:hypothetical protein